MEAPQKEHHTASLNGPSCLESSMSGQNSIVFLGNRIWQQSYPRPVHVEGLRLDFFHRRHGGQHGSMPENSGTVEFVKQPLSRWLSQMVQPAMWRKNVGQISPAGRS